MYEASTATVLEDLIGTLEQARDGYTVAAAKLAEDGYPVLSRRMTELSTQRARFRAELRMIGLSNGVELGDSSSAGITPEPGWQAMVDSLPGRDPEPVLAAAESVEEHAFGEYERALQQDDLPADLRPVIEAQAEKVRSAQDGLKAMIEQAR